MTIKTNDDDYEAMARAAFAYYDLDLSTLTSGFRDDIVAGMARRLRNANEASKYERILMGGMDDILSKNNNGSKQ